MLSQRGRYALKALIYMARSPQGAPKQVSAIAAAENIPRKFLEGICSDLRRAGLVDSARGKLGGYRLARPPELITFGEVMRVTDGPMALVPCVSHNFYQRCPDCREEEACELRRVLGRARNALAAVVDHTTLADAVGRSPFPLEEEQVMA